MLELQNINVRFGSVIANKDIFLKVKANTVHALIGENGAGKSTLMNVISGLQIPDSGRIIFHGKDITSLNTPEQRRNLGIGMVYQNFKLLSGMTVLENVILGRECSRFGVIDYKTASIEVNEIIREYAFEIEPFNIVRELPVGKKQLVELLKVLYGRAELIILDEPSAVLTPLEIEELYKIIKALISQGRTVLFITHKLHEVMHIADFITIMRSGSIIKNLKNHKIDIQEIARDMIGHELPSIAKKDAFHLDNQILNVQNLTMKHNNKYLLKNISFNINLGEIYGIAGVSGNGQDELVYVLCSKFKHFSGNVMLMGKDIKKMSRLDFFKNRGAIIPSDVERQGLLPNMPLFMNSILGKEADNGFFIDKKITSELTYRILNKYSINTKNINLKANLLSGGNKQKFIVGRELERAPIFLIAYYPTRGVDIGSVYIIHNYILKIAAVGTGVLLISSELSEITRLSHRIGVMYRGELRAELYPTEEGISKIGFYMAGGK